MIPLELTLRNFMCYRADGDSGEPLGLNFDGLHVVCLSGENGAGKSALLDAITWVLWGEARTADDDLIAQGESEMLVAMVFQLGDGRYRVERRRQRGKTGPRGGSATGKTFLDLQVADGPGWRAIGESGVRETQTKIDDLLRMSYQTFINASFLLQGRADEFTSRTPAERKQVLADILDLGEYAALEAKARERARSLDDQLKGLRGRMEGYEQSAAQLHFWAERVQEAAQLVATRIQQVDTTEQANVAAEARLRGLEAMAEQRKALLRELEKLRAEQASRVFEIDGLRAQIGTAERLVTRRAEIVAGVAALVVARAELGRLDALRGPFYQLREQRQDLKAELRAALDALKAELAKAEALRDGLRRRSGQIVALRAEIAAAQTRLHGFGPLAAERERIDGMRVGLELRINQLGKLNLRRNQLGAIIEKRQDSLVAAREEIQRTLRRLDKQLADEPRWQQEIAAAREAALRLADAEHRLGELRAQEQADGDRASALRAECVRLKGAAEKLKANQKLLDSGAGNCPVCRSDLGAAGLAHVHGHYEEELQTLRGDYAATKRQADTSDSRLSATRDAIGKLDASLATLRRSAAQVEPLDHQLTQVVSWRIERAEAQTRLDALQSQLAAKEFEPAAQAELATVVQEIADLGEPEPLAHEQRMLVERLRELDGELRERDRIDGSLARQRETVAAAEVEIGELPAAEQQAAVIATQIEAGDYAHDVRARGRTIETAIDELGYSDEALAAAQARSQELAPWEQQERELLLAEQRLSADQRLLGQAAELRVKGAAEIEQRSRNDALLETELRELPRAKADSDAQILALRSARGALQAAQNDHGEKTGYLRSAQAAADQLARERENERALAERHGLFAELGEAFGKKGVQAMLIETAIPQIEDEANRLLGRMTDNQMHLSFEMQRDTKKGDTVETLEIKIADALGTRVYDAFSGGEAMRANFAVRIALSRLLARRAGARLETLVIDEGFGSLDNLGRERMVEAITSVQNDFKRIIVITHIDDLKDRFPALIEVTKTPTGSRWELR